MRRKTLSTIIAGSFLATLATSAAFAAGQPDPKIVSMINKLTDNQVTVIETFPSIGNLVGVVIQPNNSPAAQETILYADKDGQYVISGALITPEGKNQTQVDGEKYIGSKIAQEAYGEVNNTAWIQEGNKNAKHLIYVVADPNCIYCHKLYEQTRSQVKSGDLTIRWIWVGFLKPSSKDIALTILSSKDPIKAMSMDETGFNDQTEQGALTVNKNISKEATAKFDKNMAFMNKYQFPGTPVIIYKDNKGEAQASFGLPTDAQLNSILLMQLLNNY